MASKTGVEMQRSAEGRMLRGGKKLDPFLGLIGIRW